MPYLTRSARAARTQPKQFLRVIGISVISMPKWGQGVGDRIGNSGRRTDGAAFAHAAKSTERGRGGRFNVMDFYGQEFGGGRD